MRVTRERNSPWTRLRRRADSRTSADVGIVKTDSPDPVGVGQFITYLQNPPVEDRQPAVTAWSQGMPMSQHTGARA